MLLNARKDKLFKMSLFVIDERNGIDKWAGEEKEKEEKDHKMSMSKP